MGNAQPGGLGIKRTHFKGAAAESRSLDDRDIAAQSEALGGKQGRFLDGHCRRALISSTTRRK